MEYFFENLEYSNVNIYELWHIKDEKKFHQILNSYNQRKIHNKIRDVLKSVRIFLLGVDQNLKNNFFMSDEDKLEYEHSCCEIFECIIKEIDLNKDLDVFNLSSFIDLFSLIGKTLTNSFFKIKTLCFLLSSSGESKILLKYLHHRHVKKIFNSLEIDMNQNQFEYCFEMSCKIYREELQKFFFNLKDNFIKYNISVIQNFYEFSTFKSKKDSTVPCPYAAVAKSLLKRCNSIEKIPCQTIYFDLVESEVHDDKILILINKEEKILKLIKLFRRFLQIDINIPTAEDFMIELTKLITHENSKGESKILEDYYSDICDKIFHLFLNTLLFDKIELNNLCANFVQSLEVSLKQSKATKLNKEFTLNLINYLNNISNFLIKNRALLNRNLIESFLKLLRSFCPIISQTKNEEFHKELIDLILSLINLLNASNNIDFIEFICSLIENNLNVKRSTPLHQVEWILILNGVLKYLYVVNDTNTESNFYNITHKHNENVRVSNQILKKLSERLIEKIKINYKVVSFVQDSLFEFVICKPIEMKIEYENFVFYEIIQLFYPLVSFGHLTKLLQKIKPVFKLLLEKRHEINPLNCKFYQQPSSLYLKFFTLISVLFETNPQTKTILHDELSQLVNILETDTELIIIDDEFTIYYFVLVSFSKSIFNDKNHESDVINRLFKIWLKLLVLLTKNTNDYRNSYSSIKNSFLNNLNLIANNYANNLNLFAEKIWEFYLFKDEFYEFGQVLSKILHTSTIFTKKYDIIFYKKLLQNYEYNDAKFLTSIEYLLPVIAEYSPEFFLQTNAEANEIRILTLIRYSKSINYINYLKIILKSFEIVIGVIEKSKEKSRSNRNKAAGYADYLFQYSNEINSLIDLDREEVYVFLNIFYTFLLNNLKENNYERTTLEAILKNLQAIQKKVKSDSKINLIELFENLINKLELMLLDEINNKNNLEDSDED